MCEKCGKNGESDRSDGSLASCWEAAISTDSASAIQAGLVNPQERKRGFAWDNKTQSENDGGKVLTDQLNECCQCGGRCFEFNLCGDCDSEIGVGDA